MSFSQLFHRLFPSKTDTTISIHIADEHPSLKDISDRLLKQMDLNSYLKTVYKVTFGKGDSIFASIQNSSTETEWIVDTLLNGVKDANVEAQKGLSKEVNGVVKQFIAIYSDKRDILESVTSAYTKAIMLVGDGAISKYDAKIPADSELSFSSEKSTDKTAGTGVSLEVPHIVGLPSLINGKLKAEFKTSAKMSQTSTISKEDQRKLETLSKNLMRVFSTLLVDGGVFSSSDAVSAMNTLQSIESYDGPISSKDLLKLNMCNYSFMDASQRAENRMQEYMDSLKILAEDTLDKEKVLSCVGDLDLGLMQYKNTMRSSMDPLSTLESISTDVQGIQENWFPEKNRAAVAEIKKAMSNLLFTWEVHQALEKECSSVMQKEASKNQSSVMDSRNFLSRVSFDFNKLDSTSLNDHTRLQGKVAGITSDHVLVLLDPPLAMMSSTNECNRLVHMMRIPRNQDNSISESLTLGCSVSMGIKGPDGLSVSRESNSTVTLMQSIDSNKRALKGVLTGSLPDNLIRVPEKSFQERAAMLGDLMRGYSKRPSLDNPANQKNKEGLCQLSM